jgi:predicted phage-related endonuclease
MSGLIPDVIHIFILAVVGIGSATGGLVGGYRAALNKSNSNGNGNRSNNSRNRYMSEETKDAINALSNGNKCDLERLWSAKQDNKTCEAIQKGLDKRLQAIEDDIKEILLAVRKM